MGARTWLCGVAAAAIAGCVTSQVGIETALLSARQHKPSGVHPKKVVTLDDVAAELAEALGRRHILSSPAGDREYARPADGRYNTTSAPVPGVLNVHLICHSHDDVGWLKSPEAYYSGSANIGILPSLYYADGGVQFTISSVVAGLVANPDRKFVVVEQFFFRKWYVAQTAAVQAQVQALVNAGQLTFANGGIVMADEASPTYIDMLDQATAGLRFLAEELGPAAAPRVTSSLDPFGHSSTAAAIFSSPAMGYSSVFFARMDYEEAQIRAVNRTPDFAWQASTSLGASALTVGIYGVQDGYGPPDGLCFDASIECYPFTDPINDDAQPDGVDVNVDYYVNLALQAAARYAQTYPVDADGTAHVPFMMGSDFQWKDAHMNFASLDKLVHYGNVNTSVHKVNFLYSSPALYTASRLSTTTPLTLRQGDIMPYADSPHSVWSGYFTSRPGLKGYVRDSSAVFQAAKQLQAFAGGAPPGANNYSNPLWLLETAMGVAQHHDGVSGTSKQVVAFDYARRLAQGRIAADAAISSWLNTLTGASLTWASCDLANSTICPATEAAAGSSSTIALALYNAQSHTRASVTVRVPVGVIPSLNVRSWQVLSADGATPLTAQLLPTSAADQSLRTTYYGAPAGPAGAPADGVMMWLAFVVPSIPAMGYTTVFLQPAATTADAPHTHESRVLHVAVSTDDSADQQLSNGQVTLSISGATGLLQSVAATGVAGGATLPLSQNVYWYTSSVGDAVDSQCSGAYILRQADNTSATPAANGSTVTVSVVTGPVVNEARQSFSPWASQVIRLWANATASFEVEWTVGPIPVDSLFGDGKEVISRFDVTGWDTAGAFATDSNGREMMPRQRNQRPQYPLNVTEFLAQNYYPVNTAIRMADSVNGTTMVVVTDRTQGGGSLADGSLELMVHRRLTRDDSRGVMEALAEPGVNGLGLIVRGTHTVVLADAPNVAAAHKAAQQNALLPVQWRAATLQGTAPASWAGSHNTHFTALLAPLPPQLEVVTLHSWGNNTVLLRLAHLYEVSEPPALSANATVSLAQLFTPASGLTVTAAVEMALGANQRLVDVPPTTYNVALSAAEGEARWAAGDASVRVSKAADGSVVYSQSITLPIIPPAPSGPGLTVSLAPMQIRAFLLTLS